MKITMVNLPIIFEKAPYSIYKKAWPLVWPHCPFCIWDLKSFGFGFVFLFFSFWAFFHDLWWSPNATKPSFHVSHEGMKKAKNCEDMCFLFFVLCLWGVFGEHVILANFGCISWSQAWILWFGHRELFVANASAYFSRISLGSHFAFLRRAKSSLANLRSPLSQLVM